MAHSEKPKGPRSASISPSELIQLTILSICGRWGEREIDKGQKQWVRGPRFRRGHAYTNEGGAYCVKLREGVRGIDDDSAVPTEVCGSVYGRIRQYVKPAGKCQQGAEVTVGCNRIALWRQRRTVAALYTERLKKLSAVKGGKSRTPTLEPQNCDEMSRGIGNRRRSEASTMGISDDVN